MSAAAQKKQDEQMKALELTKIDGMKTITVPVPRPEDDQVLIKVLYSAIDTSLDSIATRDLSSGFIHKMKSKPLIVGYHFSGTVKATGPKVTSTDVKVGDAVFGHLQYEPKQEQGAFAEYIVVPTTDCAKKPPSLSWTVAAASTTECTTALQALRDKGGLSKGQSVLILGAGGGVGTAAVGIAKCLGAKVTAVCSTRDVDRVKKLGADVVVNRCEQNISAIKDQFDVVFDVPTKYSFLYNGRKWLKTGGTYVNTLPTAEMMLLGWFWPLVASKKHVFVECRSSKEDLELLGQWIVDGKVQIPVDSIHDVSDFETAWERNKGSKKTGRVVIKIEGGW